MRKKFVFALFALIGLGTIVALGSSPGFVGRMIGSLQQSTLPEMFSSTNSLTEIIKRKGLSKDALRQEGAQKIETPDSMLWHIVFDFRSKIQAKADESIQRGQDGALFSDYFVRQGPLLADEDVRFKETADSYIAEIGPLDRQAKKILDESIATKSASLAELKELQSQKDEAALKFRDELKAKFSKDRFDTFQTYLKTEFSEGSFAVDEGATLSDGTRIIYYTSVSKILWNDSYQSPLIAGYSQLYFRYDFTGHSYDPYVESLLYNATLQSPMQFGSSLGYQDIFPAEVYHSIFYSTRGNQYCVATDHYGILYDGWDPTDAEQLPSTQSCHIVGPAPPTPTPTPTPSPTPPCEPLTGGALDPCQPTPTPTPTPTPSVSVTPIDVVEKYGERNISVTVRNNDAGTTKFVLTTTAGTGTATFENDTNVEVVLGNVENQPLKIKGVLESSQIDNIRIEARVNNDPAVKASDDFTVAVITSLVFEKFDSTYSELDANPGTDGVLNPDGSEGQRIFPDALDPRSQAKSFVKVKATVLPAASNLKVYIGSFDLDDPSASGPPIDNAAGVDGNDNNGLVNTSKSGDFASASGGPCANSISGAAPSYVSTIDCVTASDGTVSAGFIVTMQPGDNFAIAASVGGDYRNGLRVNTADGSQIVNGAGQTVHVSGQSNTDNIAGIRTGMLTVWRRLHIEVDTMTPPHENYVRGNVNGNTTIAVGRTKTLNLTAASLDENQFENGRMELAPITGVLDVASNTASSVTVTNSTLSDIVLADGVNFELLIGTNSALGTVPTGVTIAPAQTVTLNIAGTSLSGNFYAGGQMFITPVLRSLAITGNTPTTVTVKNNGPGSVAIANLTHFRLYDDDDYNGDDSALGPDGDENEPLVRFSDTFRYLSDSLTGGAFPDGTPNNILASAYILPEYDWAISKGYNQSNVSFDANVEQSEFSNFENIWQESLFSEKDRFWIAHFIISYQGGETDDYDGSVSGIKETVEEGLTGTSTTCDCYGSPSCPRSSPPSTCSGIPSGGHTSLLYEESMRDFGKYQSTLTGWTIKDTAIAAPHELGHQFGLLGDQPGTLFSIMDYPNNNTSPVSRVQFHPEHINIIRHRVKSPGF